MREIKFSNSHDASMYNKGYEQGRADLKNETTLFELAYKSCKNDLKKQIKELPTHIYREYDGHDEVVRRECIYLSDILSLLE